MTILIMEDDLTMIEILKSRISWRRMGVDKIMTATSTPDARAILSRERIDLMLLDIEVIRGTGIELLHWARAHGYDAPCVFLTNHANFNYAKEAVRLGSVDYVLKTESLETIERAIRRAAGMAQPDELFAAGKQAQRSLSTPAGRFAVCGQMGANAARGKTLRHAQRCSIISLTKSRPRGKRWSAYGD